MKKVYTLVLAFLLLFTYSHSQSSKLSEIGITQSFIWNKTTIYDTYSGARAANKTGQAWSIGTNINYTQGITKHLLAQIGFGYFNQRFGIHRGFDFYEPTTTTGVFYTTKNYSYRSLHYFGGLGYIATIPSKNILPANSTIRLLALYNIFHTFRQEFRHDFDFTLPGNPNPQIRKSNYHYGSSLTLKAGLVCPISKRFKVGLDLVCPVYNKWHKDVIFREDATEYQGTDFSLGTSLTIYFNLN